MSRTSTNTSTYFGSFGSSIIPQSHFVEQIRLAILAGKLSEVEKLCTKIAQNDVSNYRDVYGNTILHTAILL